MAHSRRVWGPAGAAGAKGVTAGDCTQAGPVRPWGGGRRGGWGCGGSVARPSNAPQVPFGWAGRPRFLGGPRASRRHKGCARGGLHRSTRTDSPAYGLRTFKERSYLGRSRGLHVRDRHTLLEDVPSRWTKVFPDRSESSLGVSPGAGETVRVITQGDPWCTRDGSSRHCR